MKKIVVAALLAALCLWPGLAGAQTKTGNASLSVSTVTSRVALPTWGSSAQYVLLAPAPGSSEEVFYNLGTSSVTAATTDAAIPSGGVCIQTNSSQTYIAAITAATTATIRITRLSICPNFAWRPNSTPATPSGPAGGDLAGTYPNPTVAAATAGTLTASTPFNVTQTWNNAGVTFTGIKENVTDTASASASLLLDLQVGGTTRFNVSKTGIVTANSHIFAGAASAISWTSRSSMFSPADGQITLLNNAQTGFTRLNFGGTTSSFPALAVAGTVLQARNGDNTAYVRFDPLSIALTGNTFINSDGADILSQRNTTAPQTFRVYNTYTDASNYERGVFDWSTTANTLTIGTANAGTGSARNINFVYGGTIVTSIGNSSIAIGARNLNFIVDNSQDIGASGANRPRTIYAGTSVSTSVLNASSAVSSFVGTAIPAGGTTGSGYKFSSATNFGMFFGSGAPTLSAAKGSIYLRSDGTTTNDRIYVNSDGGTTWVAIVTAS